MYGIDVHICSPYSYPATSSLSNWILNYSHVQLILLLNHTIKVENELEERRRVENTTNELCEIIICNLIWRWQITSAISNLIYTLSIIYDVSFLPFFRSSMTMLLWGKGTDETSKNLTLCGWNEKVIKKCAVSVEEVGEWNPT
jgi:hypothetical protein